MIAYFGGLVFAFRSQSCFKASSAVIRFDGSRVSSLSRRSKGFSGITLILFKIRVQEKGQFREFSKNRGDLREVFLHGSLVDFLGFESRPLRQLHYIRPS
jgi:hypothetical protein